jgi:6-phosphogluconolactonase (cycloisomerase 2 family)
LIPVQGSPFPAGTSPWSIALDPIGRFAYVANRGDDTIGAYAIDRVTGALTPVPGSPFPENPTIKGEFPWALAVDPTGKFVYVANYYAANIRGFAIDQNTGALAQVPGSPFAAGGIPRGLTVDPAGRFVYVANGYRGSPGLVSAFTIDANSGALTPVAGSPFPVPTDPKSSFGQSLPNSVTVEPSGGILYVTDSWQSDIWAYAIDEPTGALTLLPDSPFPAQDGPFSVTVIPRGKFAYSSNMGTVSAFAIARTTGALTPVPGSPFPAGFYSVSVGLSPTGQFVYAASQGSPLNNWAGSVSAYAIDQSDGKLTPVPGSPFAAGTLSTSVAVTPSPRQRVRQAASFLPAYE